MKKSQELVAKVLKKNGKSRYWLAKRAQVFGWSQAAVYRYLSGDLIPSTERWFDMIGYLTKTLETPVNIAVDKKGRSSFTVDTKRV